MHKKQQALIKIIKCAKMYGENLVNKNLLFVSMDKNKSVYFFETKFEPGNFKHLTGVKTNNVGSSTDFYNLCIKNEISLDNITIPKDGTLELKLLVLEELMRIHKTAKMVGEYTGFNIKLSTERVVGTTVACLGFVKDGAYYVPNTALKKDIRDVTSNEERQRIIAIFSKSNKQLYYDVVTYIAKGIALENCITSEVASILDLGELGIKFQQQWPVQNAAVKSTTSQKTNRLDKKQYMN